MSSASSKTGNATATVADSWESAIVGDEDGARKVSRFNFLQDRGRGGVFGVGH